MKHHRPDDNLTENWENPEPQIYIHKEMGWYYSDECEQMNPEFHRGERGFDTIEECRAALKQHIENL